MHAVTVITEIVGQDDVNDACSSLALWCLEQDPFKDTVNKGADKEGLTTLLRVHINLSLDPVLAISQVCICTYIHTYIIAPYAYMCACIVCLSVKA